MDINIKRIDKTLPLPEYHTPGAVAFDMYARETTVIPAGGYGRIPSNLIIQIPAGYLLLVKDRSSTLKRKGLLVTVGFIDQDYCGEGDEILLQFYNPQKEAVTVERGDRVGQAAFIPIERATWHETDIMNVIDRGGFGSTKF